MVTTTYLQTEKEKTTFPSSMSTLRLCVPDFGRVQPGGSSLLALFSLVRGGHSRMMAVDGSMVNVQRVLLVRETAKGKKREERVSEGASLGG